MIIKTLVALAEHFNLPEHNRVHDMRVSVVRGSPMPLLKTVSRKSNWPFHASRKIRKTASRSQKKARNHVSRKNAKAKSCFT